MTQPEPQELVNQYFEEASQHYQSRNYQEATVCYDAILLIQSDNYDAWYWRGQALRHLKHYEEALQSYEKALEIKPDEPVYWDNRGMTLRDLKRYEEALQSHEKALEIQPNYASAWNGKGNVLDDTCRYEEALEYYDRALEIQPGEAVYWDNRGMTLRDLKRYEEALQSHEKALKIQPNYAPAWNGKGNVLDDICRYEEALQYYDKAIEIKADDHIYWCNRGMTLRDLKRYEEALQSHDRALKIKPDYHTAWNERGVALRDLKRYEEALESYDRVIEIQPDYHHAWNGIGNVLDDIGRYEEALQSYDKALEIKPDDHIYWNNRGMTLRDLKRYEEALQSHDRALKIKPNYAPAWNGKGNVLDDICRYEEALASYDKAIEIKPDEHIYWNNRGMTLRDLKRYEEALQSHDRALKIKPDYHTAWNERGIALRDLKHYEEAIDSYDKALAIQSNYWYSWWGRGFAAGKSNKPDLALSLASQIARRNPEKLNLRGYEGEVASHEEGLKSLNSDEDTEGWGVLYWQLGKAHYQKANQLFKKYKNALKWNRKTEDIQQAYKLRQQTIENYEIASEFLKDYPERRLEVLEDLSKLLLEQQRVGEAEEILRQGTTILDELIRTSRSQFRRQQIAEKFIGFDQLTVEALLQNQQVIPALEIAERSKNICLSWFLQARNKDFITSSYEQMQPLLQPGTAIVYWYISPCSLSTFILKSDTIPMVLHPITSTENEIERPEASRRLEEFETWSNQWKNQYESYAPKKQEDSESEPSDNANHPWRTEMESCLEKLKEILDISAIETELQDIKNLILIPHRDLHLFPLHVLFSQSFVISYLPSVQVGLELQTKITPKSQPKYQLLSIEHPASNDLDLLYSSQVEAEMISSMSMFSESVRIANEKATKERVQTALQTAKFQAGIFHFTGHAGYNFSNPKKSALALAGEERLFLEEFLQFDFSHYELVTLAACETAITGNQTITTEYVGLVSAFLSRGVSNVISTLWRVESDGSALLMIKFYELLSQNYSFSLALSKSVDWLRHLSNGQLLEVIRTWLSFIPEDECIVRPHLEDLERDFGDKNPSEMPYSHPYYWAAFTITAATF